MDYYPKPGDFAAPAEIPKPRDLEPAAAIKKLLGPDVKREPPPARTQPPNRAERRAIKTATQRLLRKDKAVRERLAAAMAKAAAHTSETSGTPVGEPPAES